MNNREVVLAHLQRARKEAALSGVLLRRNFYEKSIACSYYAVLHAARAALESRGVTTKSHKATRNQFGLHLVQSGDIETRWARMLAEQNTLCEQADYVLEAEFDIEKTERLNAECHAFIARIRQYLLTQNFTEQELNGN